MENCQKYPEAKYMGPETFFDGKDNEKLSCSFATDLRASLDTQFPVGLFSARYIEKTITANDHHTKY